MAMARVDLGKVWWPFVFPFLNRYILENISEKQAI